MRLVFNLFYFAFRLLQVTYLLSRCILQLLLHKFRFSRPTPSNDSDFEAGTLLRGTFEKIGGTFIKFGQMLAMRPDFIPAGYCEALYKLLDDVPAFPTPIAAKIIEGELGKSTQDLFSEFSDTPIASASFGQVYRARLKTGQLVAVKVQRPDLQRQLVIDLWFIRTLIWIIDTSTVFAPVMLRPLFTEFAAWTGEELDYQVEARNAQRIHDNAQGNKDERIPSVYWEFTTRRVLTLEFLEGFWLKDIILAINSNDEDYLQRLEGAQIALTVTSTTLLNVVLRQVFKSGVYHADLHAGNIIILPGNVIGFVDFGIVGFMTEDLRRNMAKLLEEVGAGRTSGAFRAILKILEPPDNVDLVAFKQDYERNLQNWLNAVSDPRAPLKEKSTGRLLMDNLGVMRQHGISLHGNVFRYYRAFLTLDSSLLQLDPQMNSAKTIQTFLRQLGQDQVLSRFTAANILESLARWGTLVLDGPQILAEMVEQFREAQVDLSEVKKSFTSIISSVLHVVSYLCLGITVSLILCKYLLGWKDIRIVSGFTMTWANSLVLGVFSVILFSWLSRLMRYNRK